MELQLSAVDPGRDGRADVLVTAEPGASVGALASELGRLLGQPADGRPPAPPALYVDGRPLDPDLALGLSPLRDGTVVSVGAPGDRPALDARGLVEVRVTGGPDAGGVHPLGPGVAVVGRAADARIRVDDPELPESALEVAVAADGGVTVRATDGSSVTMDGEPVTTGWPWRPGGLIAAGHTLLELGAPGPATAALELEPSQDGVGLVHHRQPRVAPPHRVTRFQLPSKPPQPEGRGLPLLTSLLHRRSRRQDLAEHERSTASVERQVRAAVAAEAAARRDSAPDPAEVLRTATGPGRRLWERRLSDPDYGLLRIGTGVLPSEVEVTAPGQEGAGRTGSLLADVPVTVPMQQHGVLGVAGRGELPRQVGRWLVAQAAVLHSPDDLQICVLTDPGGRASWDWLRWLPHARPRDSRPTFALIGTDAESVARRIAELLELVAARQESAREADMTVGLFWGGPTVLVVLDGARRLRALPGLTQVLREGPRVGVHLICLDADRRLLPEECRALVEEDTRGLLQVSMAGSEPVTAVRPDGVTPAWAERTARALAPVRDASGDVVVTLPDSCRLLDVLGLDRPTGDAVAARWSSGGRSTTAVVGASLDGPFSVDLVQDGPHGLVAGTSGSGKSELLRAVVASLAVANRPDAMNFLLVDYKGGMAFQECVRLPHTVGLVTDLDAYLVERALDSLGAELRRRERILYAAGVRDIADHLVATRSDPTLAPLPRLLIVIDEFAAVTRELPDFVTGLVNIAQRGRSLGIHLLLATQRPSGVVSPEIRANTNLRIALRMTDPAESTDVIDAPDAGHIPRSAPGRAVARLGASSLLPFQAGEVGGRRGAGAETAVPAPFAVPVGWAALGRPVAERPAQARSYGDDRPTDLAVLVEAVRDAQALLAVPAQRRPWLPVLPESLVLDALDTAATPSADGLLPAPYAVDDLPAEQAQPTACIDLTTFTHLLIGGGARAGRSQALRTIAGSLARANSCGDVHLYALDCASGGLLALSALPHCGAVVSSSEADRAVRLIQRLAAELPRRRALLDERGLSDVNEQRGAVPAEERLPHLVLLLDGWEGFVASLGELDFGAQQDALLRLMEEGNSVGVHVVVSGGRSLLAGRISTLTEHKMALRTGDPLDLSPFGLDSRKAPAVMPPGRAFRVPGGVETQVALLTEDPGSRAQAAALREIGAATGRRDVAVPLARRPVPIDALPARITFEEAEKLRAGQEPGAVRGALWSMVAVGGDRLTALGPDLGDGDPAFLVAGPPRSGRSTTLLTLVRSSLLAGTQVIVAAPRAQSPLRRLEGAPGVAGCFWGEDIASDALRTALDRITGPGVVVVDDAELLRDCDADEFLQSVVRGLPGREVGIVAAAKPEALLSEYRGWLVELKKACRGLLLSPQDSWDGELIGIRRLRRSATGLPVAPGRGLLHLGDGEVRAVQVPLTTF